MYILIKDEKSLEKYNEIWKKVSNIIEKEFDSNSVYNEKYIKTKTKVYNKKINTDFLGNKMWKEGSEYICLSVFLLGSVYKKDKNYYPQVLLEECKHVIKEKKKSTKNFITDDVEISSDNTNQKNYNEEN